MKTKLFAIGMIILLLFSFTAFSASAEEEKQEQLTLLVDNAGLLTESEQETLTKQLEKILEEQKFVVAIVTMETLPEGYYSSQETADALYDQLYGKDRDGCLLLRTLDPRYVYVTTTGSGEEIIDPKLEKIFDKIEDDMINDRYEAAFSEYARLCEKYVDAAGKFPFVRNLLICLGIGLIIALIVVLIFKAQLKSVKPQNLANEYLKDGSLNITVAKDLFLYSHISKTKIERDSSSGGGGGGSSHGGGGRAM